LPSGIFNVDLQEFQYWLHKPNKKNQENHNWRLEMKKTLRGQKSGYALSSLLWFFGLAALFWTFWKTWPDVSTANDPFIVFWESLWNETLDFFPGIEFRLVYLIVLASAMLVTGFIVFGLSRKWFLIGGKNSILQYPWRKKRWRTSPDKALVLCPHCRQLVHPVLVDE
jgi:hypothetical protein